MSKFNVGDKVRVVKDIPILGISPKAEGTIERFGGGTSDINSIGVRFEALNSVRYFAEDELELVQSLHLWEVKHPYYGPESNYFLNYYDSQEYFRTHESWEDFISEGGGGDMDLNVLWRWDWILPNAEEDEEDREPESLKLFWIQPRRGAIGADTVHVTSDDEDKVREYLTKYAEYMKGLWSPLL